MPESQSSVYLADEYEKTERIKFLKSKRSFLDNHLGKINAQFAGDMVVVKNEDGSDAPDAFSHHVKPWT